MIRLFGLILVIISSRFVIGQTFAFEYDTLKYKHTILGEFDTFDLAARPISSSFLFPDETKNCYWLQPKQLFFPGHTIYSNAKSSNDNIKFTALPHIGFGYSFGSQATQKLDFDYEQSFKYGFLINAAMHNYQTDGFFRNTNAQNSHNMLDLARNGERYSFQLRANSKKIVRSWNAGILNDSLLETFSLDLIPVRKENAQSIYKNSTIQLSNKFSLVKDSSRLMGITSHHEFIDFKRFYTEQDSIATLYSLVNFDSTRTNDSLSQQTLNNRVGLFLNSQKFIFEAGLNSSLWKYGSFEYKNDTLEVGIYSQMNWKTDKISIYQKGDYNLLGASTGFDNLIQVEAEIANFKIKVLHQLTNQLPMIFQRYYYSNNVAYKTVNLDKQWSQNFSLHVDRKFNKQAFQFIYELGEFNKIYQFDSQQLVWRNDLNSCKGIYNQFTLKSQLNWRWIYCHFKYQYNAIDSSKRFTPQHAIDTRIFVKGGIFKAKKLKALAGVDFLITSSYKRLNFIPQMTLFDLENSVLNPISSGFMNLAAFTSFEVENFRFFIRLDNISYFWQNKKTELVKGYAFPTPQLKVGITWDFWN